MKISAGIKQVFWLLGITALPVMIGWGTIGLYFWSTGEKIDYAKPRHVRFVMIWSGLPVERALAVPRSYHSVSGNSDYVQAFAIQVAPLTVDDLQDGWQCGDTQTADLRKALGLLDSCHRYIPWFPATRELASDRYYFRLHELRLNGDNDAYRVQLIIARPADGQIFYFGAKI